MLSEKECLLRKYSSSRSQWTEQMVTTSDHFAKAVYAFDQFLCLGLMCLAESTENRSVCCGAACLSALQRMRIYMNALTCKRYESTLWDSPVASMIRIANAQNRQHNAGTATITIAKPCEWFMEKSQFGYIKIPRRQLIRVEADGQCEESDWSAGKIAPSAHVLQPHTHTLRSMEIIWFYCNTMVPVVHWTRWRSVYCDRNRPAHEIAMKNGKTYIAFVAVRKRPLNAIFRASSTHTLEPFIVIA